MSLATTLRAIAAPAAGARFGAGARTTVIAELPTADDLVLVSEDGQRFYYGERAIDKDLDRRRAGADQRRADRGLRVTTTGRGKPPPQATSFEDRPEGIARDRWDVAVETVSGATLIECGAIRERVSQELARAVFDAIKRRGARSEFGMTTVIWHREPIDQSMPNPQMTQRDQVCGHHSVSGAPPGG